MHIVSGAHSVSASACYAGCAMLCRRFVDGKARAAKRADEEARVRAEAERRAEAAVRSVFAGVI